MVKSKLKMETLSRSDISLANRDLPKSDMELPKRANPRNEIELASVTKSKTLLRILKVQRGSAFKLVHDRLSPHTHAIPAISILAE